MRILSERSEAQFHFSYLMREKFQLKLILTCYDNSIPHWQVQNPRHSVLSVQPLRAHTVQDETFRAS